MVEDGIEGVAGFSVLSSASTPLGIGFGQQIGDSHRLVVDVLSQAFSGLGSVEHKQRSPSLLLVEGVLVFFVVVRL